MKSRKRIEGMAVFIAYQPLSNDDAIERILTELVEDTDYKSGIGSEDALETRRMVRAFRRKMRMHGPDHGISIGERGLLKYREPH
jgi:hypothetical protein